MTPYEAVGIEIETETSVSESPVSMVTGELRSMDSPNAPDVLADQNEMSVSVSGEVPAQFVHSGSLLAATDPADALPHVTASRVVTDDTFAVPFAPGAPVCSWM
jgi:hypothetical protein